MTYYKMLQAARLAATMSVVALLSACGTIGDTSAVKEGYELAIECETEAALRAVDRAAGSGGLSGNIAGLQRVVILRDAGRTREASAALAERNARVNADAEGVAKAEKAITESIEKLRTERMQKSGRRTCP